MGSVRANQIKVEGLGETFANGSGGASVKKIKLGGFTNAEGTTNTTQSGSGKANVDSYLNLGTAVLNAYSTYTASQTKPQTTAPTPVIVNVPDSEKKSGLGTGAIIGISVGVVAIVGTIIYFAVK